MVYGGPIFHTPRMVTKMLKEIRRDVRFANKSVHVRPIGKRTDPLSAEQLTILQGSEILKMLDSEELRIIAKHSKANHA
jgi:hypothetical protein